MRAGELVGVGQVGDEALLLPFQRGGVGQQRPVRADGLGASQRAVAELVVIERRFLVPEVAVDIALQRLRFRAEIIQSGGQALHLQGFSLAALAGLAPRFQLQRVGHGQQQLGREQRLEAGVAPGHMRVGVADMLLDIGRPDRHFIAREARLIIHPAAQTRRPVGAVGPGTVGAHPLMIGQNRPEHRLQAAAVAGGEEILPLGPREDIRPSGGGVVPLEQVAAVGFGELAADKAVGVLLAVEVVQRPLKVEDTPPVLAEHQDKAGVPQEQVVVERRIDIIDHEAVFRRRLAQVAEGDLPDFPVAGDGAVVPIPERLRQRAAGFVKGGQRSGFDFSADVGVGGGEDVFDVGVELAFC